MTSYYQKNKERILIQKKEYYLQNKDKIDRLVYNREYKNKNKKIISEQKKKYYLQKTGQTQPRHTRPARPPRPPRPPRPTRPTKEIFTIRYGDFHPFRQ